jgi:hypothetical protein
MKLLKIALIMVLIAIAVSQEKDTGFDLSSQKSLENDPTKEVTEGKKKSEQTMQMENNIGKLFNLDDQQEGECNGVNLGEGEQVGVPKPGAEYAGNIPQPKENKYQKYAKGEAAYLFDHLDYLLKKKLAAKFKTIYEEAKKSPYIIKDDPYTEDTLKQQLVQGRDFRQGFAPYIKNFNQKAYEKGISVGQLKEMIYKGRWYSELVKNFHKISFDKFDFNGDGRLDLYEFILFSIIHNKPIYGQKQCITNLCYDDIFAEVIDPMFQFFDCDKSGQISAEEIWKGLRLLKRPKDEKCNIFSCKLKLDLEKDYRTISVNDFVLLNDGKVEGYLDLEEFRSGILLGFWNRQVSPWDIVDDDKYTKKTDRWDNDGADDKMCGKIKMFLPDNWKNRKNKASGKK